MQEAARLPFWQAPAIWAASDLNDRMMGAAQSGMPLASSEVATDVAARQTITASHGGVP